ncbi:uncharacterized protein LOC116114705 [Pistacia vera]|uniref:uncharacterized protein LOC116114705 n=1 Tax=Pistacia vera TaxID=55513 RepID=UPI001262F25E|nr:uncharacterized protein LOC116114705 [Pistacia vera]
MASSFAPIFAPVFNGDQYHVWAVKMKTYLRGHGLWQYVEEEKQVPYLGPNPTLNQMRVYEEEAAKAPRALSCIHSTVTDQVLSRIMACETPKQAWDTLKEEFGGSNQTRNMQTHGYGKQNQAARGGTNQRVVEKVLVSLPERFEAKISSLEDSKDLCRISLAELVHSLQAQEQRRQLRQEDSTETAMYVGQKGRVQGREDKKYSGEKKGKEKSYNQGGKRGGQRSFPPCVHYKKKNHPEYKCWFRPGIQCRSCKQYGHIEKVCKSKGIQHEQ